METESAPGQSYAVCVNNDGFTASLEKHKLYRVLPDGEASADGDLRIVDESGVVRGDFPNRALRHVLEWLDLHQEELLENWNRVQLRRPPHKIAPLE